MLSIIVPVYNAEKTLARTLDSIQGQLYKDWECILVNDGSKDGSLGVCQEYAARDSRFKVVDKPNGGVSSARNKGLEMVQGNFVAFCDADDVLEPVMYDELIKALQKESVDVASCNFTHEKTLSEFSRIIEEFVVLYKPLNYLHDENYHIAALWNKVFCREVLENLAFDIEIHYSEDQLFVVQALAKCRRMVATQGAYYHYIDYANSATKQLGSYEFWSGYVKAMSNILEIVEQSNCNQFCINTAREKYAVSVFSLLRLAVLLRDREAYDRYLTKHRELLYNFISSGKIKIDKKLCYWSYCQGYCFASLVHYYLKRH